MRKEFNYYNCVIKSLKWHINARKADSLKVKRSDRNRLDFMFHAHTSGREREREKEWRRRGREDGGNLPHSAPLEDSLMITLFLSQRKKENKYWHLREFDARTHNCLVSKKTSQNGEKTLVTFHYFKWLQVFLVLPSSLTCYFPYAMRISDRYWKGAEHFSNLGNKLQVTRFSFLLFTTRYYFSFFFLKH